MAGAVDPQIALRFCTTCRAVYHSDFARCPNDGGVLELVDGDPLIGRTIAHYKIDAHIGSGAMGRVYRCHHTHLQHKQVALKVLRGDLAATMSMRLRFTAEAEAASRLIHPNVVPVTDFGRTDEGLLYLAMDFVEGEDLSTVIAKRPISPRRTVKLARQLCLGLAHAHEQGLVHRDFKPDNIIVVRDGDAEVPRIVDFGLAIHADPDADHARLTTAGAAVGTPVYAAPEQMSDVDDVDHRADLFALGVTMFEMLAGQIPFDGNMLETMHMNATAERPTIASRSPGIVVPLRLEQLVHELMRPAREDRPASTREVIAELDAIEAEMLRGASALITPPAGLAIVGSTVKLPKAPARRRAPLVVAVAAIAAAAAAAVIVTIAMRSDDAAAMRPPVVREPVAQPPAPTGPAVVTPPPQLAHEPTATDPSPPDPGKPARPQLHAKPHHAKHAGSNATQVVAEADTGAGPPDPTPPVAAETHDLRDASTPPAHDPPDARLADPIVKVVPVKPKLVTSARVVIDGLSVRGSLTTAQIKRAIDRVTPVLRACYGPSATQAGKSPGVAIRVRFEIDESQRASGIQTTAAELPGLSACVDKALATVRAEAAPDVGTVDVTFVVQYLPEGT